RRGASLEIQALRPPEQEIRARAHCAQRHDGMPWFERARRRLRQEWRVEHEVLEADDRRVAVAQKPGDVGAREAATDDEHVPLFYALPHGASLRDRERCGA